MYYSCFMSLYETVIYEYIYDKYEVIVQFLNSVASFSNSNK